MREEYTENQLCRMNDKDTKWIPQFQIAEVKVEKSFLME